MYLMTKSAILLRSFGVKDLEIGIAFCDLFYQFVKKLCKIFSEVKVNLKIFF